MIKMKRLGLALMILMFLPSLGFGQQVVWERVLGEKRVQDHFARYNPDDSALLQALYSRFGLLVIRDNADGPKGQCDITTRIVDMVVLEADRGVYLGSYETDVRLMRQVLGLLDSYLGRKYVGEDTLEAINQFAVPLIDGNQQWYIDQRGEGIHPRDMDTSKAGFVHAFLRLKQAHIQNNKEERKMLFRSWLAANHSRLVVLRENDFDDALFDAWDDIFGEEDEGEAAWAEAMPKLVEIAKQHTSPVFDAIYGRNLWKWETDRLLREFGVSQGPTFGKHERVSEKLREFLNVGFAETALLNKEGNKTGRYQRIWSSSTDGRDTEPTVEKAFLALANYRSYALAGLVGTKTNEQVRKEISEVINKTDPVMGPADELHYSDILGSTPFFVGLDARAVAFDSKGRVKNEAWLSKSGFYYEIQFPENHVKKPVGFILPRSDGATRKKVTVRNEHRSEVWFEDFDVNYGFEDITRYSYTYGPQGNVSRIVCSHDDWDTSSSDLDFKKVAARTRGVVNGQGGTTYLDLKFENGLLQGVSTFYSGFIGDFGLSPSLAETLGIPHPVWWEHDGGYDGPLEGNSSVVKIEVTFDRGLANGELRVYRVVPDQGKTFVAKFTYTEGLRGPKPGHWVVVPD